MKGWLPGTWILCAALGLLSGGAGCDSETAQMRKPPPPPKLLTVVTPHNEKIRRTFQHNFSKWYAAAHGTSVDFRWVDLGTPECLAYVVDVAENSGRDDPRPKPDVLFGGGAADHAALAEKDLALAVDLSESTSAIPAEIDGVPTRDPQGRWYATGLSSFGILYNAEACRQRGIAPPTAWDDLAEPRFYGWIALSDPAGSGSTRECLLLILRQEGWESGWGVILRILANARALADRSAVALHQVALGVSLATVAVNYDGMDLADGSGGRLVYLNPPEKTGVSANAVCALRTGADPELARDFVRYCVGEEGQKLWGLNCEKRGGMGDTLYHYPINPSIYERYADQLALPENPLTNPFGVRIDPAAHVADAALLLPMIRAAVRRDHVLLQQAWAEVIEKGLPSAAVEELVRPPFDRQTLTDLCVDYNAAESGEAERMMTEWQDLFRAKYERVRTMCGR